MPRGRKNLCPDCEGFRVRDGKCRECFGSGGSIHLNSASPSCLVCGGDGLCPACRGTGLKTWKLNDLGGQSQSRSYLISAMFFPIIPALWFQSWYFLIPAVPVAVYCLQKSFTWHQKSRKTVSDE